MSIKPIINQRAQVAQSHTLLLHPRPEVARDRDVVPDIIGSKVVARLRAVEDDLEIAEKKGAHDAALEIHRAKLPCANKYKVKHCRQCGAAAENTLTLSGCE